VEGIRTFPPLTLAPALPARPLQVLMLSLLKTLCAPGIQNAPPPLPPPPPPLPPPLPPLAPEAPAAVPAESRVAAGDEVAGEVEKAMVGASGEVDAGGTIEGVEEAGVPAAAAAEAAGAGAPSARKDQQEPLVHCLSSCGDGGTGGGTAPVRYMDALALVAEALSFLTQPGGEGDRGGGGGGNGGGGVLSCPCPELLRQVQLAALKVSEDHLAAHGWLEQEGDDQEGGEGLAMRDAERLFGLA
jgi:hypothetical protein